ncbi:PAQR family membrane homeostasis protein TrhA [Lacipirellula parvula]|uniref:Uncharacterized protein n=1 Tax=Lacipirellula parvula TaxID=2650471 RepID=A0A5K7XC07_9BACT|nr:hemolysin III family protein [Lacipirellula parvula]BBO33482.1 hypothetical protein PLANPX_3094 [Lacipirellula parvula]
MPLTPIPGFADPVSSLSHLLGAVIFLALGFFLIRRGAGSVPRMISLGVFVFGAVLLLSVSGTYHLLDPKGKPREVMRVLDHAAIFTLIACTFTPVHVILFRGIGRWGSLLAIWGFAVVAITCKSIYFYTMPEWLGLSLYLGMGWIGLASGGALYRRFGFAFVAPILWGGIAYSIGALLDHMKWPEIWPGAIRSHEVFHIAVLIGLACHWSFIYSIADGRLPPIADEA